MQLLQVRNTTIFCSITIFANKLEQPMQLSFSTLIKVSFRIIKPVKNISPTTFQCSLLRQMRGQGDAPLQQSDLGVHPVSEEAGAVDQVWQMDAG